MSGDTFKEMLTFAKKHAGSLDGLLFYKVDRAARNLFDYVELERFEEEFGVPVVYVSQPTENTPAGRMQRRILANLASFYTEQQSVDVREGLGRRVQSGLFVGKAPYGYRNIRIDGRSLIEVDPENAPKYVASTIYMPTRGSRSTRLFRSWPMRVCRTRSERSASTEPKSTPSFATGPTSGRFGIKGNGFPACMIR